MFGSDIIIFKVISSIGAHLRMLAWCWPNSKLTSFTGSACDLLLDSASECVFLWCFFYSSTPVSHRRSSEWLCTAAVLSWYWAKPAKLIGYRSFDIWGCSSSDAVNLSSQHLAQKLDTNLTNVGWVRLDAWMVYLSNKISVSGWWELEFGGCSHHKIH